MNQQVAPALVKDDDPSFKIEVMTDRLKDILPSHIPPERFANIVRTAINNNADLKACTKQSLWNACMKAAQDGLLPDGREGAIVPYGENDQGSKKADIATWMPMIAGIRKKARNSGEIKDWYVEVVYDGDNFDYQKGDDPRLLHKPVRPSLRNPNKLPHGGIVAAYSVAVLSDGYKTAPEVMWIEDIEGIRAKSKAKKGPWSDPTFYPEMCKKVVARRHAKVLPSSTDLDDVLRRDDDLYDLNAPPVRLTPPPAPKAIAKPALVAKQPAPERPPVEDAEIVTDEPQGDPDARQAPAIDNPDRFLDDLEGQMAAATDLDTLSEIWVTNVQPYEESIFPPDFDKATALYDKHKARIEG